MLTLLKAFAALSMVCGVMLSLLPAGSLRRTAALVAGLLLMLCWADGLRALLHLPQASPPPDTVLTSAAVPLPQAEAAAQTFLLSQEDATP